MAGDWIKMRVGLAKDPRVIAIADYLATSRAFMDWLSCPVRRSCDETAYEHVTRDVTVAVTVSALLQVWGVANEAGKPDGDDLVLKHSVLNSLDAVAGVPDFGEAMAHVEWAIEEDIGDTPVVRLPKFLINNVPAGDRKRSSAAERQRRYRERSNAKSDAKSNASRHVTRDVTVTPREEKRREEEKKQKRASGDAPVDPVAALWAKWKALPDGGGGAFLARMVKAHGEQAVLEAVERTLDHAPADPKSFVQGCLRKASGTENAHDALIAGAVWEGKP